MIRLFQPGDLYLIQRLNRQRTHFLTVSSLLNSHSVMRAVLGSLIPWDDAKVLTYVLRQEGHSLVSSGFLQMQKRSGAPEQDVVCIAPGLDARHGHPAIWTKLLAHSLYAAMEQGVVRVFCDVTDQPLPINTVAGTGFQTYGRETIWRLFPPATDRQQKSNGNAITADIHLMRPEDSWGLTRLYEKTVPTPVQLAEGWVGDPESTLPILSTWSASHGATYVAIEHNEVVGALQMAEGRYGCWMQLWADTLQPGSDIVRQLISFGLTLVRSQQLHTPVYIAVADYHGGVAARLDEVGFVPFSDRVKMVKHVMQRVRESALAPTPAIETIGEVVPAPFAPPEGVHAEPVSAHQDAVFCRIHQGTDCVQPT